MAAQMPVGLLEGIAVVSVELIIREFPALEATSRLPPGLAAGKRLVLKAAKHTPRSMPAVL